jgi:hypothetical protein
LFLVKGLHSIAAQRGDGLRQEFLELLTQREAHSAANVEELSMHFAEHFLQAGPNPVGDIGTAASANVLPFSKPGQNDIGSAKSNTPALRRNL